MKSLLCKYSHAFSKDDYDLGLCHLTEHAINVEPEAKPIRQPPRCVPLAYADEERKAIEDLEKKGVIQKSTIPWSSAIVLVKKKNGGIRLCVNYRRLNALVRPEGFPMPRIQDCLDAVAWATLFSVFDLTSRYFQIPLEKEDIQKSSFVTKYGQYEFKTMPFGLNSASSTFQRTMEVVMASMQWTTCLIYIDDIIVFSTNFEEHISRVQEEFSRISRAGLKLQPDKCEMLKGIEYTHEEGLTSVDYDLKLRSASVDISRQQGSRSDVPRQQYKYIFNTGICRSRQPESKTGENDRRQKRSITIDAGRQQKSS